jgi:hypothetical protein
MKISPQSLSINQFLSATNEQYVIPTYQRRYSWHERQIWDLIDDIELMEDGDTHLLGSIVCLVGHYTAGINKLELVDGQQRLTTISILLECICQHLKIVGDTDGAADVAKLLSAKPLSGKPIRKITLDSIDSKEFDCLVQNDQFQEYKNPQLQKAFLVIRRWIDEQTPENLHKFLYQLTNRAIVIRLDVSDAKDAFKLFETINNRGLRLSPTDIIKNFLLGNAARFSEEALKSACTSWADLIKYLDGTNSDAFFRYYLMSFLQVRVSASDVVEKFKDAFMNQVIEADSLPERHLYLPTIEQEDDETEYEVMEDEDIEDTPKNLSKDKVRGSSKKVKKDSLKNFLSRLVQSAKVYGDIVLASTSDPSTNRHLRNLRMIKAVQTYGFLMHLRVGGCGDKLFCEVLRLTESFVLRRHICRERANEMETLFAKLCGVNPIEPMQATKEAYADLCPTDEKFRDEFANTIFTANLIDRARYCLEQIEMSKHGAHDEIVVLGADDVHVEHIIPQKIKTKKAQDEFGDWVSYLGDKAEALHPKYVSRIGNLTIFSGTLNIGASNNPFMKKKQAYKESGIELTKELAKISQFKFKQVQQRSIDLAEIAVKLWPRP